MSSIRAAFNIFFQSAAQIEQIVSERLANFAHQPPIFIVDRPAAISPQFAADRISGMTYKGKVYLVRAGLEDNVPVERGVFHELFHYRFPIK